MLEINRLVVEAAVANFGGAMEAETISKHWRSSKSQMSRGNFLKKTCLAVLAVVVMICGLLFSGCSSDTPSSVVKKMLNAAKQKDGDAFVKYWYDLSDSDKMLLRNEVKRGDYNDVKFEIKDERIYDNGEKAEVIVIFFDKEGDKEKTYIQLIKTSNGWKIEYI